LVPPIDNFSSVLSNEDDEEETGLCQGFSMVPVVLVVVLVVVLDFSSVIVCGGIELESAQMANQLTTTIPPNFQADSLARAVATLEEIVDLALEDDDVTVVNDGFPKRAAGTSMPSKLAMVGIFRAT
jgi:hypothetical protein